MARRPLPTNHRAKPNNRVKPIIQELTRKVKRGQYEEVQSLRDHAQGMEAVPQGREQLCRSPAPGMEQRKGRPGQRPAHRGSPVGRRNHRAGEHLGGLESRRVHGGAWRKGSVSGGADPQQQGRRPNLPGIVLRCIAGAAAGSPVTRTETPGGKMEAHRA